MKNIIELWRPILGYEDFYAVSNLGRIKSIERIVANSSKSSRIVKERILKSRPNCKNGYLEVNLSKDNKTATKRIHCLVANAFIPNPNGYKYVNHINEDKTDNRVENLEWCTVEYNNTFGTRIARQILARSKKVNQYSLDGILIATFPSAKEAGRQMGNKSNGAISTACKKGYSAYGYKWGFA